MKKVRIVGVPEHFNLPWHMAIEEGAFEERGIELSWTDVPEGTGKMSQLLKDGQTDLAIILTEGIVKSITEGNPVKIVQEYIATPLLWGIHVGFQSQYTHISELNGTKAAISRFGSGSHLMAFVNAQNKEWDTSALRFEVIHNLDGAVEALSNGNADYFMWEHFTTKPLVDSKKFRRLGDSPTPWPCFVIAATTRFIDENENLMTHILQLINKYTVEFKNIPSIDRSLANRYGQKLGDIQEWLSLTRWSQKQLDRETLNQVSTTLKGLSLIAKDAPDDDILW